MQQPRIIPGVRRRVRDILRRRGRQVAGPSPVITAPVGRPDVATGHSDIWKLVDLVREDRLWDVSVRLPDDHGLESASLVLVGRSSHHELSARMVLTERTASTTLAETSLTGFSAETMDVWIDTIDLEATSARQRVSLARSVDADRLAAMSVPAAHWYATKNENLSVEVAPPTAGTVSSRAPELIDATQDRFATTRLVITEVLGAAPGAGGGLDHDDLPDLDDHELNGPTPVEPVLLLVGRRSRLELGFDLSEGPAGWSGVVAEEDLTVFGVETVDLFVVGSLSAQVQSRRRLTAGGVEFSSGRGAVRRWYATAEGNVSVRRQTPVEAIAEAGVFDEAFYRAQVPDLPGGIDPIEHYVTKGAAEGLNPSSMFVTAYYKRMNPSIRRRNPLAHYCEFGWKELAEPVDVVQHVVVLVQASRSGRRLRESVGTLRSTRQDRGAVDPAGAAAVPQARSGASLRRR